MDTNVTILLVDDDKLSAMAFKRSFSALKILNRLIEARGGFEALDRLRGRNGCEKVPQPCLILLDMRMPHMSGIEFLEELRGDRSLRRILVFVMTGSISPENRTRVYDMNVAGVIPKPVSGSSFLKTVEMLREYWRVIEFPD
jgi:CheY-like chemotaxis protein